MTNLYSSPKHSYSSALRKLTEQVSSRSKRACSPYNESLTATLPPESSCKPTSSLAMFDEIFSNASAPHS